MMPFMGFLGSRMPTLAGLLLAAVLPLTRRCVVRLRERRGTAWRFKGWGEAAEAAAAVGEVRVVGEETVWVFGEGACCAACWSWGKSSWVGDTLGPSEPCWLWVVTFSEVVAVVPVLCGAVGSDIFASGSLPTTELLPLHEWPLVLAYMAEPMLYSEEKESRFSAASTSDRDLASDKEDG
jgi:hypothetical protein